MASRKRFNMLSNDSSKIDELWKKNSEEKKLKLQDSTNWILDDARPINNISIKHAIEAIKKQVHGRISPNLIVTIKKELRKLDQIAIDKLFDDQELFDLFMRAMTNEGNKLRTIYHLVNLLVSLSISKVVVKKMVSPKFIDAVIKVLCYNDLPIIDKMMPILVKIALHSDTSREQLLNKKLLKWMETFLQNHLYRQDNPGDQSHANSLASFSWALSCFCLKIDSLTQRMVKHFILQKFTQIIECGEEIALSNFLRILFKTTKKQDSKEKEMIRLEIIEKMMLKSNILKSLVKLTNQEEHKPALYSIFIIGNLVVCEESIIQILIWDFGILQKLQDLVNHKKRDIREETMNLIKIVNGLQLN